MASRSTAFPLLCGIALALTGCASSGPKLPTVEHVDVERFMGDWFVIANIPTRFERGAYNAVERYELMDDGRIRTTFTFRKGGFNGESKRFDAIGSVHDPTTGAEWRMQFVWPLRSEYLIVALDDAYETAMVARSRLDYLWIMARSPTIEAGRLDELVDLAEDLGYDISRIRAVPQRW